MYVSRLSAKGQVTIPKKVRDTLGLVPGDQVGYRLRGDKVVLFRIEPFDAAFHTTVGDTLEEWASPQDEEAFRDL